ncbi:cadherin-related family member 2 [Engraulis encrasicolus]|uniref:cadherin-related family member 2 n=1 Tax=Engraulis encrasicolus TaxID=184585 RepID=UPI002FD26C8F
MAQTAKANMGPIIDNDPVISLREDIAVGSPAFTIIATDPEGDPLTFGISGPGAVYFNVDATTGVVTVKLSLDREDPAFDGILPITLTAKDANTLTPSSCTIVLEDANDNAPRFVNIPYNAEIPENAALATSVITVSATDPDSGVAGAVTYSISGASPSDGTALFEIGSRTGLIKLKGELSFTDKSSFYQLTILAQDGGGPLGDVPNVIQQTSTFVLITVKDVPNLDPQFINLPNVVTVEEGTPVGTTVFTVRARDPDTGILSPIEYSIKSPAVSDLFAINSASGNITVKSELDREQHLLTDGVITLEIEAKETKQDVSGGHAVTTSKLEITIGDVNDEKPEFYNCANPDSCELANSFSGNIDEHSATGLPVLELKIRVIDKDRGINSRFDLSLDGPDKDAFSVVPTSAQSEVDVQIVVKNPAIVDFEEKQSMSVTIIAVDSEDTAFQSTAIVTIAINDVNDNSPTFKNETYKLEVPEHSPAGTSIATITATDLDTEDQGNIVYKLLPETILTYFDVVETTGEIKVKNGDLLDREGRNLFSATLQARDMANNIGSAILEITLTDINDNKPRMVREKYIEFVNEGDMNFQLQIQAFDDDEANTPNSEIVYAILPGDYSNNFTINPETGVLKLNEPLNREAIDPSLNGMIKLNVTAFDKGTPPLGSSVMVEINVLFQDVNDNKPHFQKKEYHFEVKEAEQGAFINSVLAKDEDQTEMNNRISFSIKGGGDGSFSVRSIQATPRDLGYWGNISVDQDTMLDYETRKSYEFEVEAMDLDRKSDTAKVFLKVLDVNDETPTLPTDIILKVKENTTLEGDGVFGTIVGKDVDTNHELEYKLVSTECPCFKDGVCEEDWFLVEPLGEVKLDPKFVVDFEACHEVILHVEVTDILTEVGKNSSEGQVTVKIEDINDNIPEFIPVQPHFVIIAEDIKQGSSVAAVSAYDRDSGENALMTLKVLGVTFTDLSNQTNDEGVIFEVTSLSQTNRNCSATISSLRSLGSTQGQYLVKVEVTDKGGLKSTSEVLIYTAANDLRVTLQFNISTDKFNENKDVIIWALEQATGATVHIMSVNAKQRSVQTIVNAYFVKPDGSALSYDGVMNAVIGNENPEYRDVLLELGLNAVTPPDPAPEVDRTETYILLATVGTLMILLIVMTTVMVFMRRNYQRKLKASKAMNSATMDIEDNQKSGPVVPGTNKYTMEGANPVLNMNIDTATDLGFDEDDSSADRSSINSLDDNVDMTMSDRDNMPMMVIDEEEEEDGDLQDPSYYEPIMETVLAGRGKNRKGGRNSPPLAFDNPSMSTTDL